MLSNSLNLKSSLIYFIFFVVFFSAFCCKKKDSSDTTYQTSTDTVKTYCNPVGGITDIGDPYMLYHNHQYYLYATSSGDGFYVWQSPNMVDWEKKGFALNKFNNGNNWGNGNFWAPEVKYFKGKYYMTYSAISTNGKMKVRIASSDSPLGPFLNYSEPFLQDDNFSYIDADLYIEGEKLYLYFVKDCSENLIDGKKVSQIFACELSADLKSFIGYPQLILTPSQNWEGVGGDYQWNEGPFVMKYKTTYFLFYSANYYASHDYSVGVASASNPLGPWTKYSGNPVLKQNLSIGVSGPGHCMVTISPDSTEFFMVYHTHTDFANPSGNRNVCIDRLVFENNIPRVLGPSRSNQLLPNGIKYRIVNKVALH